VGARLRLAGQPAFTRGAKSSADGLSKLAREAGQADRKVTGLERAAKRTRSALGKVAKGAALGAIGVAAAGAAGAVGFLAKGLQDASDLSETLSKSSTVFGKKSAEQVRAWAYDSTKNILMTREAAISGAATLGNLFTAMGVGQKPAADLSLGLVGLASDLASFNNVETDEALLALRSGLLGEAEPLRKFGVQLSASRIEAEALEMGLVKLAKGTKKQKIELTSAQKAQAAYSIIMKDTKVAQGDAARTQDGFANSTRKLRKNIADARAEIGLKLLPTAERLTKWANDVAVPGLTKLADEFQNGKGRGGELRDTLADLGRKLQTGYEKTKQVVDFVIQHRDAFATITAGVVGYKVAMAGAAAASALMGLNGPKAAAGMTVAGAQGAIGAVGVRAFGSAALAAAGPIGALVGALMALEALGHSLEIGGKGTYGKLGKAIKNKDLGAAWDAAWGEGFIKDEWQNGGKTSAPKLHPAVPFGARARGGPVTAGFAYRVNEYGPEVFVPRTSGRIAPASQHPAAGGGDVVVNMHNEFHGYTGGPHDADRLVEVVRRGVRQELARR
jgi:hypothetical protein